MPAPDRLLYARLIPLLLCLAALAGGGYVAVAGVGPEEREARAWEAAEACPAMSGTPDIGRDCRTTVRGVVEETHAERPKRRGHAPNWIAFRNDKPAPKVNVADFDTAAEYGPGDRVELTWWRGRLMTVSGEGRTFDQNVPAPRALAVLVTVAVPIAAGGLVLWLGRRRRAGQSVAPGERGDAGGKAFLVPILATAAWTILLAALRPGVGVAQGVALACGLGTLALTAIAWRQTGSRGRPEERVLPAGEDTYVPAMILGRVPYEGHFGGSWIVVRDDSMALVPSKSRFGAKEIPVRRLRVQHVRRPRAEEEGVPSSWHVAELLDGDTPVRLTAAPDDLAALLDRIRSVALPESGAAPTA
ncbi:hypothetical protein G5C51_10705 [Streptomyces sp. A7024]|uniref:Uncharacterized protein n=1 Tax=Streptomyces coryli TaxID=1128680 RepID=A0A6G4TX75_9ACTN|nr:hypothetical protein [Streptomyces coryli]NGN64372.1 hypothetical protein [Streptomyces coryli]